MYEYHCKIIRVVDGDTVDVQIDLGLSIFSNQRIRLYGINAPETSTPEGKQAREFLKGIVGMSGNDARWILRTIKDKTEKYGRYLGELLANEVADSLSKQMLDTGHAKEYYGGAR